MKTGSQPDRACGRKAALALALGGGFLLAACTEGQGPFAGLGGRTSAPPAAADIGAEAAEVVERDVEAPEVFSVTANALWDGRYSFGGIWVAHADVGKPERVVIRNLDNGKVVEGVLYKLEREQDGAPFRLSSDAAEALKVKPGTPTRIEVVAIRRVAVPVAPPPEQEAEPTDPEDQQTAAETETADEQTVRNEATPPKRPQAARRRAAGEGSPGAEAIAAAAAAALAEGGSEAGEITASPLETTTAAAAPSGEAGVKRPYVQAAIFAREENAEQAAEKLRAKGIPARVLKTEIGGKTFWRLVAGPVSTPAEQADLLQKVREAGFTDAYAVSS